MLRVQTMLVPAVSSAIAEFKVEVPDTFIMVGHSILRAFNQGALAERYHLDPEHWLFISQN